MFTDPFFIQLSKRKKKKIYIYIYIISQTFVTVGWLAKNIKPYK